MELEPVLTLWTIVGSALRSGNRGQSEYITQESPSFVVVGLSSQPPADTEATITNHSDAFEKVKAAIVRVNVVQ